MYPAPYFSMLTNFKAPDAEKTSAFDDTESFNDSLFESAQEEEQTALLRPQKINRYSEEEDGYNGLHGKSHKAGQDSALDLLASGFYPGWHLDADEERRRLAQQEIRTPQPKRPRDHGMHVDPRSRYPQPLMFSDRQDPDSPSRTQSAPPENDMIPRKNVRIEELPQIMNPSSPNLVSSEMAREDSLEQPISRPNSAQPQLQSLLVDVRPPALIRQPQNQMRQSGAIPSHAPHFDSIQEHVRNGRLGNPKVSAPESDIQDFSEDERAQLPQQPGHQEQPPLAAQQSNGRARKRSYDDMSDELDYSQNDLKQKRLSDLQSEPFPQDPRVAPRTPPRDNAGNEMSLDQILSNLSKMSDEAQREAFRTLTDEQWASTGQWFVDKFQTDLKRLMDVRFQRRQVSMAYEDKIRRRQRVVEQYKAQVDKELDELQTGGRELVNGRKMPSGSRSATPMKGGR